MLARHIFDCNRHAYSVNGTIWYNLEMIDGDWVPEEKKQTTISRSTVKEIIDDFPAIEKAADESAISVHTEKARGYLEDILNLPEDERRSWDSEIDSLNGILRSWEKRKNLNV